MSGGTYDSTRAPAAGAPATQSNTTPAIRVEGIDGPVEKKVEAPGIPDIAADVGEPLQHDDRVRRVGAPPVFRSHRDDVAVPGGVRDAVARRDQEQISQTLRAGRPLGDDLVEAEQYFLGFDADRTRIGNDLDDLGGGHIGWTAGRHAR